MAKIVIELTNRCNLKCQHCFTGRHGGKDDLPLEILHKILAEARDNGFDHLSFTGGDPTVHRHFWDVLQLTSQAGCRFGFNTNGWNFVQIYPRLLSYRDHLDIITFSLDGATESSHDRLRGKGSFRRVMQAISVCMMKDIPFSINMVVTAHNRHQLEQMAGLATRLGSRGLRFGHLMPSPLTTAQNFDLSPWERKRVEAEIRLLQRQSSLPIAIAPGFHTTDLFPCGPLNLQEINIDCHGNVTKCCHLSGHGEGVGQEDIIGSLHRMTFTEIYQQLVQENEKFRQAKIGHLSSGTFQDSDFFPCWYCSLYYKKVGWLRQHQGHPWGSLMGDQAEPDGKPVAVSTQPIALNA